MTEDLNTPENALRALLAGGPLKSREVLTTLGEGQLSAKQIRRAREKVGVLIERAGSGATMHSTWSLPDLPKPHVEQQRGAGDNPLPAAFVPITESIATTAPDGATEAGPPAPVSTAVSTLHPRRAARSAATGRRPALSPETEAMMLACGACGIPVKVRQVDARQVRARQVRTSVRTEAKPVADLAPR